MSSAGINQATMARYAAQLGTFMNELIYSEDIRLEDVKRNLVMKI